jgi:hypothetical protein
MAIEFKTAAQQEGYEALRDYLSVLGLSFTTLSDNPAFQVGFRDSPTALLQVLPWGDDNSVVRFMSYLVKDAKLPPEALTYLLRTNNERFIGLLSLDDDDWVVCSQSILGSDLGRDSCAAIIELVTDQDTANDFIAKFGGERHGGWEPKT